MLEFITAFSLTNVAVRRHRVCAPPDEHSVVQACLMLKLGSVGVVKTTFHRIVLYKRSCSLFEGKRLDIVSLYRLHYLTVP